MTLIIYAATIFEYYGSNYELKKSYTLNLFTLTNHKHAST